MTKLVLFILAASLGASTLTYASDVHLTKTCEGALVVGESVDRALDAQFNSNLSQIEAQVSTCSPAECQDAEEISEYLLRDTKSSLNIKHAISDHFTFASFFFAYSIGAIGMSDKVIALIRNQGTTNYLTLHTSNFIEGIGYTGLFHQNLCAGVLFCSMAIQKSKATSWVQKKLHQLRIKGDRQDYQTRMLYLSALLFTLGNANSELKDLYHLSSTQNDWHDFMTGQISLVPYYFLSKLIQRHGPAFLEEMRGRGWLAQRENP